MGLDRELVEDVRRLRQEEQAAGDAKPEPCDCVRAILEHHGLMEEFGKYGCDAVDWLCERLKEARTKAPPAADDARALAERIVAAMDAIVGLVRDNPDSDAIRARYHEVMKEDRHDFYGSRRRARVEWVESVLREHAAPPAPAREAPFSGRPENGREPDGVDVEPWRAALEAWHNTAHLSNAATRWKRVVDAVLRAASPRPAVPAAIVQTYSNGHPRYDAFESREQALEFCEGIGGKEPPDCEYRFFRFDDGPVTWHPNAPAASEGGDRP